MRQKGSSESKTAGENASAATTTAGRLHQRRAVARAARRLGPRGSTSTRLSIALFCSFVGVLRAPCRRRRARTTRSRRLHGEPRRRVVEYVGQLKFWFESFQNWQSEFLSVGVLIVLTIFLRQKGSPQSKEVGSRTRRRARIEAFGTLLE